MKSPLQQRAGSKDLVQALPIVIIRTNNGQILKMKRREKSADNPLHERIVVWAGGHVFERRGTSLKSRFVDLQDVVENELEPWSDIIVRKILGADISATERRLL